MLGGLLGGGGGAPKGTKAKIGGTRINCIDANKSQSHHGAQLQGKTKGAGNGMGNTAANPGPAPGFFGGFGGYPGGGGYGDFFGGGGGGNASGNWMGNIENFFGGSFFVQVYAKKSDEINSLLPQVAEMDDKELLA